ncbi:TetR/AcrR family transcriptional regulator [Lactiplantibacillus daowaiensis]|uniref:TetR/AcrR family transcriptional regulator n=1 Tax=Lactiplantibacillus daowaiensis TaxID=2559918 RepID=A0ABW1S2H8_9LACO
MIVNPRRYATQKRIQQALITLIAQMTFKQVTVGALIKTAQVSRGTFYRYYLDKYDLLSKTEDRLIIGARDIFTHYDKPDLTVLPVGKVNDAFYALLVYLYRHRRAVTILLNCGDSTLQLKIHDLIRATIRLPLATTLTTAETVAMPVALIEELVVQNIMTILAFWLRQPTIIAPKAAYQIFVQSRRLSPIALTGLLQEKSAMEARS